MDEIQPAEALALAEGVVGQPMPAEVAPFAAAVMLLLQEAVKGGCPCPPCGRLRDIALGMEEL